MDWPLQVAWYTTLTLTVHPSIDGDWEQSDSVKRNM
jgi:hypothetical protein